MGNEYIQTVRQLQLNYKEKIGELQGEIDFTLMENCPPDACFITRGEGNGKNFLLWQTFNYAKERACDPPQSKMLGEGRFFNDLCSDAALTLNLFYPIKLMLNEDPRSATHVLSNALHNYAINAVCEIGIFSLSDFAARYIAPDMALDAYLIWMDRNGGRHFTGITVQYAHRASVEEVGDVALQRSQLVTSGLFTPEFEERIFAGDIKVTPLYRNFLLAERYREVSALKDSYSVLLAPREHPDVQGEVESVTRYLTDGMKYKQQSVCMEHFVEALILYSPDFYKDAFFLFKERYLSFGQGW